MQRNIIRAIVGIGVVIGLASVTVLSTKVEIQERHLQDQAVIEQIVSNKGFVRLENFNKEPKRVEYLSPNILEIEGNHMEYGDGVFQVNLDEMTLTQVQNTQNIDPENYETILELSNGLVLTMKDERPGLFFQSAEGALKKISGNFIAGDTPAIKVSANENKLIYYVEQSRQMATYDFMTGKKKVISGTLPEAVINNFTSSVELSPDGGYFMIMDTSGTLAEHSINIYGSDSGRKYADEIQGTMACWSPTGDRLSFVYSGLSSPDETALRDTRIGYIKLPEKEVVYFDTLLHDQTMDSGFYWDESGLEVSYIKYVPGQSPEFHTYLVEEKTIKSFYMPEAMPYEPTTVIVSKGHAVLCWEDDMKLQVLNLDGTPLTNLERIDTISNFDDENYPFAVDKSSVLYYQEDHILIQSENNREVVYRDGLEKIKFLAESNWIVAGRSTEGGYDLELIYRNKP